MKTALLVDTANLYYTIRKAFPDRKLDYTKLKEMFEPDLLYAYGTRLSNEAKNFIDSLKQIGYVTKFVYTTPGKITSLNVDITITVILIREKISKVILVSNDRDLIPLIYFLRENGVKVFVVGCGLHKDLKVASDGIFEISEDILEEKTNV
jgi:uncharacterized LabA/DUF88 family protein